MKTLEELKEKWTENQDGISIPGQYDQMALGKILKSRVKKHTNAAMQYFWASFVFQIVVYSLLSHTLLKYWPDAEIRFFSIGGILLFLPFTVLLMQKFKRIAITKLTEGNTGASLSQYVMQHYTLLLSFYNFKKRYEFILIPLSSVIGIIITFKLFVPGGVFAHLTGALITLGITLLSCAMAIRSENKKSFEQPLHHLREILEELGS